MHGFFGWCEGEVGWETRVDSIQGHELVDSGGGMDQNVVGMDTMDNDQYVFGLMFDVRNP